MFNFTSYILRSARVFPLVAIRVLLLLDCTEARHNWSDSTGLLHRVWSRGVCVPTYIRSGLHLGVMGANRHPSPHIDRLSHTGLHSAESYSTGFVLFPNLFISTTFGAKQIAPSHHTFPKAQVGANKITHNF